MNEENLDEALLAKIEAHSTNIAQGAGQIVLEQFRQPLEVKFKGKQNNDPVTAADHLSEEYLQRAIKEQFPSHNILGEEGGALSKSDSPFVWVIDPLDGTANFMNGLPLFAVSVGVLWQGQPVAGSIYVPVSHCAAPGVYHARRGKGAYLDKEKIAVTAKPSGRPLCEIPPFFGGKFRLAGRSRKDPFEARNLGSIALEITLAASGVFQYAVFGSPKLWDVAAGILLVREAGGIAFTRDQKAWLPVEQFKVKPKDNTGELENLRRWSLPVVVGSPEAAGKIVKDIRTPQNPLSTLIARFRFQR